MKRLSALLVLGTLATVGALGLTGSASGAASSMPTLKIALNGTKGVSVSGSAVSGAVNVVSTFTGKAPSGFGNAPAFGLVRLRPGATIQQAAGAVQSHHGDINALTPYATLYVDASAPGAIQTALTPGNWVALNITGQGNPGIAPFTVSQSSSPAALPAAKATETAIDFGFRGPSVLHNGWAVRAENRGWLVHMVTLNGVRSRIAGLTLMKLLRVTSNPNAARPFLNGAFVNLLGPASNGAMQQMVLRTKPGYYVEACFMDAQDGREHVKLGMERLVRVLK